MLEYACACAFESTFSVLLALPALACSGSDTSPQVQRDHELSCHETQRNDATRRDTRPETPWKQKTWTVLYYPTLPVTKMERQPDGSIDEKFPWWRGVTSGRPLDPRSSHRRLGSAAPFAGSLRLGDSGFKASRSS